VLGSDPIGSPRPHGVARGDRRQKEFFLYLEVPTAARLPEGGECGGSVVHVSGCRPAQSQGDGKRLVVVAREGDEGGMPLHVIRG